MRVHLSDDPGAVLAAASTFLESDPIQHNLLLTLLNFRVERPEPGRYAWVTDDAAVVGVLFQSPLTFHAQLSPMPATAAIALAEAVAPIAPDLPGAAGDAATAARFAGAWASALRMPVTPMHGQRIYRLGTLVEPTGVPGELRMPDANELPLLTEWFIDFGVETNQTAPPDPAAAMGRAVEAGRFRVWDDGGAVCMVGAVAPTCGVARVAPVYTPPEHRGRGYAAACTAGVSRGYVESGAAVILYTELANPTSNGVYARIGYEPVAELVHYRFG